MFKDIIANLVGRFWSIFSNFLFIPLYIQILGFDAYSIISFSLVIAGLMAMLDAGLTATLSREFARVDITLQEKIKTFKTLETAYLGLCSLFVIILVFSTRTIAKSWLNLSSEEIEKVSYFLKIVIVDFGFQLIMRFYTGGLMGLNSQVKANIFQVICGVVRNGLVLAVIYFWPSLELFFIWQTTATIFFTVLVRFSLVKALTGYYNFFYKPIIDKFVFSRVWRFTGGMLLISLIACLNTQMDKVIISKLLPIKNLGYYTLGVTLSMGIITIVSPISTALLPRFTALYSIRKRSEASNLYRQVNLFVAILIFSLMSTLFIFSKELIWIWTGNRELSQVASIYLPIIAMAMAMLSLQIMAFNVCIANGYTKLNNLLGFLSIFITIPGYWFATKYFGAIGTAYIFCIVQTLITFIYLYIVNKKFSIGQSLFALYFKQLLFPLTISLFVAFLFSIVLKLIPNSRVTNLIFLGFSTLFSMGISVLVLIDKNETKKIYNFLIKLKKN